jgi:DNA-binding transcriptional LysR family regulator
VELTPLGKVVLGHARDIIARVDATGEAVDRFLSGAAGRIDIGTFQSVSNVLLPAIVQRLRREHPDLDIRLFEHEDMDAGTDAVLAGELDVTFAIGERSGELESVLLLEDPFVVVAPAGELPDGPYPTVELDGQPLVGYPPSACQHDVEDGLRANGVTPRFVFRTYDNGAQLAMVRAGMGWAVMPLLAVDTRDPAVDIRTLAPAIAPRRVCMVWRRDRTLSPVATRMVEIAAEVAGDLRQLPAA